ncbi:MAG: four helix bundle protein [Bacteroidota bacterium]|nr:four helix bundle protein [Bacteroidota bacterium]
MNNERKYDLEDRLVDFAVMIIRITESLINTKAGNYIGGQLVRSGTSPALHYGEAQSAESRNDFIHKLKVLLKELRESRSSMKIIKKAPLIENMEMIDKGMIECNELISIFVKSIETAKKNLGNKNSKTALT